MRLLDHAMTEVMEAENAREVIQVVESYETSANLAAEEKQILCDLGSKLVKEFSEKYG